MVDIGLVRRINSDQGVRDGSVEIGACRCDILATDCGPAIATLNGFPGAAGRTGRRDGANARTSFQRYLGLNSRNAA